MSRRYIIATLALALALTGCVAQPVSQERPAPTTSTVTATPNDALAPSATPSANPEPVAPVVPAPVEPVLDIAVTDVMPWAETWEPPTFDGVFRVIDEAYGFPEDGTQYILAHARTPWRGYSPGNDWVDRITEPGQVVVLDGIRYVVGVIGTVDKPSLADAPIWGPHDPDAAYLITCVPLLDGSTATQNRIITLQKEETA